MCVRPDSIRGRGGAIFSPTDETPLAGGPAARQRRILGTVEAPDVAVAKAAATVQFDLDEIQRNRIMVQELA
jgi:hypothetical protein